MHLDPFTPILVAIAFSVILISLVMARLRQPSVVAYLIAGIMLGPHGLSFIENQEAITQFGNIGVVLLLFFTGMEVSPKSLGKIWKTIVIRALIQILLTLITVWVFGGLLSWQNNRILLIAFVLTISSTAVVIKLLQDWGELTSSLGQKLLGILLVQDLAVIPMMIILSSMDASYIENKVIVTQIICGIIISALAIYVASKETIHLSFLQPFKKDKEMQIFTALLICFGFALVTGASNLSTGLC